VPSGDLEQSLRADIEGYINGRLSGLQEEVVRLQSQFNEAFTRLLERMDGAAQTDASVAVAISEHLRGARNAGIEDAAAESSRARASSDIAIIKAAIDDLESQHTQADILNALVNRAVSFAPRIAFFVVKNDRATGWRARGLEGTVGDDAVREISMPLSSDTLVSEVVRTRSSWSGSPGAHGEDHQLYGKFGDEPPQRVVAVPMVAREKAVAVLYADSAGQDAGAVNLEALETLVRVAGMSVELLASRRNAPAAAPAQAPAQEAPARREAVEESAPAHEERREPEVEPEAEPEAAREFEAQPAGFEPQAQSFDSRPQGFEAQPQSFDSRPQTFDAQPSYSAPPAESAESAEPARAESGGGAPEYPGTPSIETPPTPSEPAPEVSPLGASRRYGAADMEFPVEVGEEERRYHNEARRFARLLVSEIKLYNEKKVQEGVDAGDLYNRLREDIDRSRQMYDKRVRPEVSGRYDYFHHELVNMLAGGDSSRLGEGYPGASVSA
jgi:GAF domain